MKDLKTDKQIDDTPVAIIVIGWLITIMILMLIDIQNLQKMNFLHCGLS